MGALLLIIDGMGLGPPGTGNAVTPATMPYLFGLMRDHGVASLEASGSAVGLEAGCVGNSEVGHLTIGAGTRVPATLSVINDAFLDGRWENHLLWSALAAPAVLHVVGLLSDAGVHGHVRTMLQAARLAERRGAKRIVLHLILDGVDAPSKSAPALLKTVQEKAAQIAGASIGLIMGRRWFCDRSGDTSQTEQFIGSITGRLPCPAFNAELLARHLAAATESTFPAHHSDPDFAIGANDAVLIASHRADRARQAADGLAQHATVHGMIDLGPAVPRGRAFFPASPLENGLGFELQRHGISNLRVAEQCKFPHVTYFLNGFNEMLGEDQLCIPSIAESRIRENPAMSLAAVVSAVESAMLPQRYRAVVANVANLDQVGHLGDYPTAAEAAQHVDAALRHLAKVARRNGWTMLVTSDHGNAERVTDAQGEPHVSHTDAPVPLIPVLSRGAPRWRETTGELSNVAAAFLQSLDLPIPSHMTQPLYSPAA